MSSARGPIADEAGLTHSETVTLTVNDVDEFDVGEYQKGGKKKGAAEPAESALSIYADNQLLHVPIARIRPNPEQPRVTLIQSSDDDGYEVAPLQERAPVSAKVPVEALSLSSVSRELGEAIGVHLMVHDHDDVRGALKRDAKGRAPRGDTAAVRALVDNRTP